MIGRVASVLALAMAPALALASDGIDPADVCSAQPDGVKTASPVALVYAALKAGGPVSNGMFDVDLDGDETMREKIPGLLDVEYCTNTPKSRCGNGDQNRLRNANVELQAFLETGVRIETVGTPTPADIADQPLLGDEEYGALAQALDEKKRFVRMVCLAADADTGEPGIRKQAKKGLSFADRFRLSGTIEGLGLPRGTPKQLAAVPQAEVSYVDNRQNDVQTFNISAVAGHEFSRSANRTFIPFVGLKQKRIKKADALPGTQDAGDISKWSLGFLYGAAFESLDELAIAPVYVVDDQDDSRVFAMRASWTPGFLYSINRLPFQQARDMGPVYLKFGLQVLAQAGRVVDAGTNAELAAQDDYLRVGPAASMYLWPRTDNVFLSKLSADASYKYLRDFSDSRNVIWSDVGINYSVDPSDHVTLRYSYERGRDEETLEETKEWKVSVGVKF